RLRPVERRHPREDVGVALQQLDRQPAGVVAVAQHWVRAGDVLQRGDLALDFAPVIDELFRRAAAGAGLLTVERGVEHLRFERLQPAPAPGYHRHDGYAERGAQPGRVDA